MSDISKASLPKAIFLMGPTASGKTALAIELRKILPVELISVDSALIYKGMDIGTAKPNAEELLAAPHRLLDIRDPSQAYSAADFRRDALAEMADITAAGRIPLLVGGTMLYFKALLEGLSPLPSADPEVRARIEQQAAEQGWESLHRQLQEIDPVAAARIHPNDPQRLSRALEVFFISGKTLTELTQTSGDALPYQVHQFAIAPASRELLHQRIEQRWLQVLKQKSGRFLPEEICIRICLPFVAWVIARCGLTLKAKSHTMKWFIEVFAPRDSWRSGR